MGGRGRHDGAGHGVLAVGLRGGGQRQQLALGDADSCRDTGDRVLILEDTVELQCRSDDHVGMRSEPGVTTMADLVRATLRLRPDRIVVGEVRGAEALDLLKAWGTGHPGGIATVHAGSARGALTRLEQLVQEVSVTVPRALIEEAVNVIVFIAGRGRARRVREIVRVIGHDRDGYQLDGSLGPPFPPIQQVAASHSPFSTSSTKGESS